jgi:hypothetical protein
MDVAVLSIRAHANSYAARLDVLIKMFIYYVRTVTLVNQEFHKECMHVCKRVSYFLWIYNIL